MRLEHASADARGHDGSVLRPSTVTTPAQRGRETSSVISSLPSRNFQQHTCKDHAHQDDDAHLASLADAPVICCQVAQSDPSYVVHEEQDQSRSSEIMHTKTDSMSSEDIDQAVRAEAAKVQAKFMASVNTATEVVVRFDFLTEHDSRVSVYAVAAAVAALLDSAATNSRYGFRLSCLSLKQLQLLGLSSCWFNLPTS